MVSSTLNSLVATRFLTLIAHFTIAVIALWAKDENVRASLPINHNVNDFNSKSNEMTVGLSLAIACIGLEMIGFLSGVSFFMSFLSLICILSHLIQYFVSGFKILKIHLRIILNSFSAIAAHSSATVLLAHFLFDVWNCEVYWWIFTFCSALPATLEICAFLKLFQQL